VVIWYIFPRFGKLYHEKSGNPGVLSAVTAKNQDLASFIHTYEKGSNLGDQRIIWKSHQTYVALSEKVSKIFGLFRNIQQPKIAQEAKIRTILSL
jgi:hypothetical protein